MTADPERDIKTLQNVNFVMFGGDVIVDKADAGADCRVDACHVKAEG